MARHHTLWADVRLADAYDLVSDVVRDHAIPEDGLREIADLLKEIDKADQLLAGILHDRRSAA